MPSVTPRRPIRPRSGSGIRPPAASGAAWRTARHSPGRGHQPRRHADRRGRRVLQPEGCGLADRMGCYDRQASLDRNRVGGHRHERGILPRWQVARRCVWPFQQPGHRPRSALGGRDRGGAGGSVRRGRWRRQQRLIPPRRSTSRLGRLRPHRDLDAATRALLVDLPGHTKWVDCEAFSPDRTRLATGGFDQTVGLGYGHPPARSVPSAATRASSGTWPLARTASFWSR